LHLVMDNANDIIELKFEGNGISPSTVKPHEIAELIFNFEKALLSTIKEMHPEIDTEQLLFSFDAIRDESLDLRFIPRKASPAVLSSYQFISDSISTGDYRNLNNVTLGHLKAITKFSRKHNCTGHLTHNGTTLSTFTPATEITLNKTQIIKGETTIFGRLMDAGGENPNVHLKINDDYVLIFSTSEANAKALAAKLYEKVALKGIAKWDPETLRIEDFKLNDILEYTPGKASRAIKDLKRLSSGFWDRFNTNDEINNQLLRD
jgi:hypothetical protein